MNQTILLIEDENAIADNIIYALETDGFGTIRHATGKEGMETLDKEHVDLIILDIGLPDCSGFELCKEIRAKSSIPIIFLTARSNEVDRIVGLEIGGDDYVVKPFSPRELSARVRAVLRRTVKKSGEAISSPDHSPFPFEIDEHRRIIQYYGRKLHLSRYEFRILEILIRHPGWVYSREKLMNMGWDAPEMSTERTVDTHIKTLRVKLKAVTPGCDPIITHRSQGYSLKETW